MSEKNYRQALTFKIEFIDPDFQGESLPLRVMTVTGDTTLYDFAGHITVIFDRDFTRAFGFYNNLEDWRASTDSYELYADIDDEPGENSKSVKKTPVDQVLFQPGQKMLFLFDYGQELKFRLELIRLSEVNPQETYPVLEDALGSVPGMPISPMVTLAEDGTDDMGRHYYEMELESFKRIIQLFKVETREDIPLVKPWSLEVFYDHLIHKVNFPFYGVYGEQQPGQQEAIYHNVQVNSIQDPDSTEDLDKFGLLCNIVINEKEAMMPLAEIVINQGDPNFTFVEDYAVWYWDHREIK